MKEPHPIQAAIGTAAQDAEIKRLEELVAKDREAQREMLGQIFENAKGYTNLVMAGGYVGAFTIWNFTKDLLPTVAHAWVALLLTTSLLAFIGFEVFMMVVRSWQMLNLKQIAAFDGKPGDYDRAVQRIRARQRKMMSAVLGIWVAIMAVAGGTVLAAVAICFWHFGGTAFEPLFAPGG